MKASKFFILILTASALAACSSTDAEQKNKAFLYQAAAAKVRALEVPPDLTSPVSNERYGIPGAEGEGVARYSDFFKGGRTAGGSGSNVLPEARNVRLMRNDAQRWLLVSDKAENIWPVVKAFWQENGLNIKLDNPQAGIVETDWAENRAKIPTNGVRKLLHLNSSGERDQYRTRMERSKDGKSTEIYIKHSALQQVADNEWMTSYTWLPRESDPELEATMLQMLMAKLSGAVMAPAEAQAAEKSGQSPEQKTIAVKLQTSADGSKSILLGEPFDKSWRKVSLALEQAGIALEDKDRSKGIFFLRAAKNADKDAAGQVNVREISGGCEVTVSNGKAGRTPDAQRLIDALYQQISKQ